LDRKYTSVAEQIEYGLDTVDPARRVEVSLKDLLYVHQTLTELISFFHQEERYKSLDDVKRFLGDHNAGMFSHMSESLYHKLRDMLPKDIEEMFDEGRFDNPVPPYYHAADSTAAFDTLEAKSGHEDMGL